MLRSFIVTYGRAIVCSAIIAMCGSSVAQAQLIQRMWTAQLPSGAQNLTFSQDCKRYAYLIGETLLVRASALTGLPIDSIQLPVHSGIAYGGDAIHVLTGRLSTGVHLAYVQDGDDSLYFTDITLPSIFPSLGGFLAKLENVWITSGPGQPHVSIYYQVGETFHSGTSPTTYTGNWVLVDTATKRTASKSSGPSRLRSVNVNADASLRILTNSYDSEILVLAELLKAPGGTLYRSTVRPTSAANRPVATGMAWLVYLNNILFDMRTGLFYTDSMAPAIVSNFGPQGLMLGMMPDSNINAVGSYDFVSKEWKQFDQLGGAAPASVGALVYTPLQVAFLSDIKQSRLIRYNVPTQTPAPAVTRFERSTDTAYAHDSVFCNVFSTLPLNGISYRWLLVDSVLATTTVPFMKFAPVQQGTFEMSVELLDTNGVVVGTYTNVKDLHVLRPKGLILLNKFGNGPIWSLDISQRSTMLALGGQAIMSIMKFTDENCDQCMVPISSMKEGGIIGFAGFEDSVAVTTRIDGERMGEYRLRWRLIPIDSGGGRTYMMTPHGLFADYVDQQLKAKPMAFYGKVMHHEPSDRYYTYVRTAGDWSFREHDDYVTATPIYSPDPSGKIFRPQLSQAVTDADVGYKNALVVTVGGGVIVMDLIRRDTTDSIALPLGRSTLSSLMLDDNTIVGTSGIVRRDLTWSLTHPFPFDDGIKVIRLPNRYYVFVLRANRDTLGHVVSVTDGSIVQSLVRGYGTPICAVYDSKRSAVHIGDSLGFVSTWELEREYVTHIALSDQPRSQTLKITPNPTDGAFHIDLDEEPLEVYACNLLGEEVGVNRLAPATYTIEGAAPGAYSIHVRTPRGSKGSVLLKK